jgi:AcrR family transcriptional regulator
MTTVRNPDQTRARLLDAAFQEIYQHGFQGMRVDDVLTRTGLKKGAFYHHFASKQELGYAVLDDVIRGFLGKRWLEGMQQGDDPIDALEAVIDEMAASAPADEPFRGCALNNLAQEMAPLDAGFQQRINEVFNIWIGAIADALSRGQKNGTIMDTVDPQITATFIVGAIEGCVGLTKASQQRQTFHACREQLSQYLKTLRP